MNHRNFRHGMTLIELLTALTLSSMLSMTLFSLLMSMNQSQSRLRLDNPHRPWLKSMICQLEMDYRSCRSIEITTKQILLDGYGKYLDAEGQNRMGPTRIRYSISSDEEGNWMFRESSNLLTGTLKREFVCKGPARFLDTDGLDTDVAPGIVRIGLEIEMDDFSAVTEPEASVESVIICLVRNGSSH